MISRIPILTGLPLTGQYRYRDLLQLIPPGPKDPRPSMFLAWYGATLAVAFNERTAPERSQDIWAYDHAERSRISFLEEKVRGGTGDSAWLEGAIRAQGMHRRSAIEHEAMRLLVVLTNNRFRKPGNGLHEWFLEAGTNRAAYAQRGYPSFVTDGYGEFWQGETPEIPRVEARAHFGFADSPRIVTELELPLDLDDCLDDYFGLSSPRKIVCARAFELFWNAQEIWLTSRSLSLTAYVFALDALCHADDPKPRRCAACDNLLSEEVCATCHGPRFGLTRRFRDFVNQFVDDAEERKFARDLFHVRSAIAHRGELLRADEFDAGFNVGGSDDQGDLERGVGRLVRKVLLGWLSQEARKAVVA